MKNTNKLELAKRLSRIEMFHLIAGDRTNHLPFERLEAEIDKLLTQTQQDTLQWCLDEVVGRDEKKDYSYQNVPEENNFEHQDIDTRNNFRTEMRQAIKQRKEGRR